MIDFKREPGLWLGLMFMAAFMGFLDVMLGKGFVRAARTPSFDQAPGVVTKSEIRRAKKGAATHILEYAYTVNGQQFTGQDYHAQPQIVGDRYWIAAYDSLPVGKAVTVYFNPADPSDAVLVPGLRPDSFLVMWVLIPFNLILVGLLWAAWWCVADRRAFDPTLSRCVRTTRDGWRIRASPLTSFVVSVFFSLLGLTFAGSFVVGGSTFVFDVTPLWLPLMLWTIALLGAVAIGCYLSQQGLSHINELEGTISFPLRWSRVTIAREQILGLDVTTDTRKRKNDETYDVFVVTMCWRNAFDQKESAKLAEYGERRDADALAAWLRERLGVVRTPAVACT